MKLSIASDHRGLELLEVIKRQLLEGGHDVRLRGPQQEESCDYPDLAAMVCADMQSAEAERGILICGTGIGMCITANKFKGVRAALALDELSAQLSRSHNDANVLCLSGDLVGHALARRILDTWMSTGFDGGRHARRVDKISQLESRPGVTKP
ncbi:MAG: ribose 5-phosphate isomerase B [Planctomycetota bacterium]|nr:ribose 5-phosphate isomerase B [Planctomycetota bacterium]MEC9158575.1 ribose 5-phosphate isomerase B [Planctomycetota bacterium]MEC9233187.1 ribose 5-phosphate isomerase B [Planctomycetota bacterium]MED5508484.1 ribose 5-phosphate isomerase B [Planctomycetota bacterium]